MTVASSTLESIVEPMRLPVRGFAELVRNLAGEHVMGMTLFGAIAAGSFDATLHTVRSVVVIDAVDLRMLRRLSEHGVKLGKAHIAAPLIMTPKYIQESLDTFPLELIEIHQNHINLFGKDYFGDLTFDDAHVRLQCEREFKVTTLGLRQGLLAAAGREKVLAQLIAGSGERLLRTLRGLLWIKGRKEAQPAAEVIKEVENLLNRKFPGVRSSLEPTGQNEWDHFQALYGDVAALAETVNAW
jgi:hypothetical protein